MSRPPSSTVARKASATSPSGMRPRFHRLARRRKETDSLLTREDTLPGSPAMSSATLRSSPTKCWYTDASCTISSMSGLTSSTVMSSPMSRSARASRRRTIRLRQFPSSVRPRSHSSPTSCPTLTPVRRTLDPSSTNWAAASRARSRMSSSIPGTALTLAVTHP